MHAADLTNTLLSPTPLIASHPAPIMPHSFPGLPRTSDADPHGMMAQMQRYTTDLKRALREKDDALRAIEQAHLGALMLLTRAAEYRDDETSVHMDRVGVLARHLAQLMGRTPAEAEMLRDSAPMHDIGKIAIPDAILKKPGRFDDSERRIMCEHTISGARILGHSEIPLFRVAAEVALTHHECWDGGGYPRQLRGEAIPWTGRVVSLVDFFDALTMHRVYRKAMGDDVALDMIRQERGRKFEPEMTDIFLAHAAEFIALREEVNASAQEYDALLDPDPDRGTAGLGQGV